MTLHLLTVLCIRPKRRGEKPVGMSDRYPNKIYLLLFLRFFREVGVSTWNSMSVFFPLSFQCLLVGKMEWRKRMGGSFFFLITFWNLSVVVIKTWRGLMRRNTDNKISFALFQIHTLWLITIVLSIKTLGYAWCAVHHMQCKAQYLWMFSELAFFIKVFVLLVSQLKEMMF